MGRRQDGRCSGFVREPGIGAAMMPIDRSGSVGSSLSIDGLSSSDIQEIVDSTDRIGPDDVERIMDQEIHQSFGAEKRNFGACK
ncbi:MAG TPA: hypothetical protein PKD34_01605 [Candidatus Doudnabacteria bacterium]|mgnify:CR=1 FL=1|nr:hypothetical protein [Candidatus Doudnabacteria bacterium]